MNSVVNTIMKIADAEKGNSICINITGGTNLMAGAACAASFFIGAKAYYILDQSKLPKGSTIQDQLIELPIPHIPYIDSLQNTQVTILKKIYDLGGKITNKHLKDELKITPQKLSYHIKELENKRLITTKRGWKEAILRQNRKITRVDKRKITIQLTNAGRLVVSWLAP